MSVSEREVLLAGRYRLESKIATGGMGEVWRAEDTVLERPVAVKLIRAEHAGDLETLARFRDEARHAAAVSHPGIAHVYDYGESGPARLPFIVMELVDGPSLTELLARGPLDVPHVLDVVAQAAAALAAAHAAGLVHRDIKPGNLLISPDGSLKITDFGIAHAADSAPLTRTGTLIGTPAYLAPERIAGAPGSPACDLYALGMVAYECLAGALPFSGTAVEVTLAYARRELPPLPASVPGPVAALIAELTAKDPQARPASAAEVAARAARLLDPPQLTAPPFAAEPFAAEQSAAPPFAAPPFAAPPFAAPPFSAARSATQFFATEAEPGLVPGGPFWPVSAAGEHPTLEDIPAMALGRGGRWPNAGAARRHDRRGRRRMVLTAAVLAVIAGLGGWLVARDALGTSPPAISGTQKPAATPSPTATTVDVNGAALVGLPVQQAEQQLRQLGLNVTVTQVPGLGQAQGTVLAVQPSGPVQPGTTVTLDAASVSSGRRHRRDDGGGGFIGGAQNGG
jgi:eukaryotic-like serine/threonine-protein kinase